MLAKNHKESTKKHDGDWLQVHFYTYRDHHLYAT